MSALILLSYSTFLSVSVSHQLLIIGMRNQLSMEQNGAYSSKQVRLREIFHKST